MSFLRVAAAVAALLYVAVFAMKNMEPAVLDLVFFEIGPMPVALVALVAMGAGAALASLALAWPVLQGRVQQRRDTRKIEELEREVHGLRTLPISDDQLDSTRVPEG